MWCVVLSVADLEDVGEVLERERFFGCFGVPRNVFENDKVIK